MKLNVRKGLLAILAVCFAVCLAVGLVACDKGENQNQNQNQNGTQFSDEWTYDDVAHWHAALDADSDEISGYEEHIPVDEGVTVGSYVYYTCEICGAEYRSEKSTYIVYVKNIGDAGIAGVTVSLYDANNALISTVTSGVGGITRFRNLDAANYTAKVDSSTIPAGYSWEESDLTVQLTDTVKSQSVYLTPHLIEQSMPSGTSYSLGSVMYDFSYTAYYKDGTSGTVSLSDYLKDYKAVVIQFFYTTCSACLQEFPYMNQAYNYSESSLGTNFYDEIALIEFDYTGLGDNLTLMQNFIANKYGYDNFAYVLDTAGIYSNFKVSAYPTTVVIDRYGVVAYWEEGSMPSVSSWTKLFEKYIAEDYVPNYSSVNNGSGDDDTIEIEKPDVDMPAGSDIAAAIVKTNTLTTADTFTFSAYYEDDLPDPYSYPWILNEDNTAIKGVTDYIHTSNANKLGTYSIIVIDVRLKAGEALAFDYYLSTELDGDYLYIQVDSVLQAKLSGVSDSWQTFYYVAQYEGAYQITLTYMKDTSVDEELDSVYLSNLRLESASSVDGKQLATPDLLYNAATAYTTESDTAEYGPGYGYKNYVSVYLSSDGFYHVDIAGEGKEDGDDPDDDPFLLADLYYTTPWNNTLSVWNIAFGYLYSSSDEEGEEDEDAADTDDETTTPGKGILYENKDYAQAIEDYTWVQQATTWGYVPINAQLAEILKAVVKSYGTVAQEGNENQWLEVCRYYLHYGAAHAEDETCLATDNIALTYGLRMPEYVGTIGSDNVEGNEFVIHANVIEPILPQGFYYSFTAETEGVYLIYTNEPYSDVYGTTEDGKTGVNPYGTITDIDGHKIAANDDFDLSTYSGKDSDGNATSYYNNNFLMYAYLKAGETYMIACAMSYQEDIGEYDVYVRYIGATYSYLTTATTDSYYTYRITEEDTYEYYVPTVFSDYYSDNDGMYWAYNDDGTATPIYINMTGITFNNIGYSDYTIEKAIEAGYWKGTENTTIRNYLAQALANTDVADDGTSLQGYVQATEELVKLINNFVNGGDTSLYCDTAWFLTASYLRVINTYTVSAHRIIDTVE